jgi:uncharacterized protein (DUF983 family)
MAPSLGSRVLAIAAQRCPVCLEGRMFAGRFRMNEQCPVCGHRFMREPGYFQGAMYVSYVLATAVFLVLAWGGQLLLGRRLGFWGALAAAAAVQMLLVPALYRFSRVIWAHVNVHTQP